MLKATDFTLASKDLHKSLDFEAELKTDSRLMLETSAGRDDPGKHDTLKP